MAQAERSPGAVTDGSPPRGARSVRRRGVHRRVVGLLLLGLSLATLVRPGAAQTEEHPARELFVTQCARCHGEDGGGVGSTELERPARSFKDGGFSFGNTPEAIGRTVRNGIPGSPMPAFGDAFSAEQMEQLAEYVTLLGPSMRAVDVEEMVLGVSDRAVVVRGALPPIAEGAPTRPRGLLVGDTEGFSFEYRVDDVRLLGVRQGDFVRRTDWTGRGGSPLAPLGQLVWTRARGDPPPAFSLLADDGNGGTGVATALRSRFRGTEVRGGEWWVDRTLESEQGGLAAYVRETARAVGTSVGSGLRREFSCRAGPEARRLAWRVADGEADPIVTFTADDGSTWRVDDHGGQIIAATSVSGDARWDATQTHAVVNLPPAGAARVRVTIMLLPSWSPSIRDQMLEELTR